MTTLASVEQQLACQERPDLFHAPDGQHAGTANYERRVALAKAYCARCPITADCRQRGRELRSSGVWGGEDDVERAAAGHKPRSQRARVA